MLILTNCQRLSMYYHESEKFLGTSRDSPSVHSLFLLVLCHMNSTRFTWWGLWEIYSHCCCKWRRKIKSVKYAHRLLQKKGLLSRKEDIDGVQFWSLIPAWRREILPTPVPPSSCLISPTGWHPGQQDLSFKKIDCEHCNQTSRKKAIPLEKHLWGSQPWSQPQNTNPPID